MKKYLKIIEQIAEDGLPNKKLKDYKLEIKQVHCNRVGIVEVKLFHKKKLVLKFKEGFNDSLKKSKTYECSKEQHKTLVNIGQNIFTNIDEILCEEIKGETNDLGRI